jgi:hypothetical protein
MYQAKLVVSVITCETSWRTYYPTADKVDIPLPQNDSVAFDLATEPPAPSRSNMQAMESDDESHGASETEVVASIFRFIPSSIPSAQRRKRPRSGSGSRLESQRKVCPPTLRGLLQLKGICHRSSVRTLASRFVIKQVICLSGNLTPTQLKEIGGNCNQIDNQA